jgi:hypothetical protein
VIAVDTKSNTPDSCRSTFLTLAISIFIGIPVFFLITVITWGLPLILLIGFAGLGAACLLHYLLWGWWLSPSEAGEPEEPIACTQADDNPAELPSEE